MAMDREKRKQVIIVSIVAALLLAPLIALSPWGMNKLEDMAERNAPEEWAGDLQLRLASAYGLTLRRPKQRAAFERFLKHFPNHRRVFYARFMIAFCVEKDLTVARQTAIETYEIFIDEFYDNPDPECKGLVRRAEKAIKGLEATR